MEIARTDRVPFAVLRAEASQQHHGRQWLRSFGRGSRGRARTRRLPTWLPASFSTLANSLDVGVGAGNEQRATERGRPVAGPDLARQLDQRRGKDRLSVDDPSEHRGQLFVRGAHRGQPLVVLVHGHQLRAVAQHLDPYRTRHVRDDVAELQRRGPELGERISARDQRGDLERRRRERGERPFLLAGLAAERRQVRQHVPPK